MDFFLKTSILLGALCLLGLAQDLNTNLENSEKEIVDIPKDDNVPTQMLSKDLTFIHKYNDTERNGTQEATSKFTLPGGLSNKIQNLGGVQKTVLKNKIQYNFYFWLLPKNFNTTGWGLGKNEKKENF